MENSVLVDNLAEPLFANAHAALTFAYRFNHQCASPSVMLKMMRGPVGSGKGLAGIDGAAQAGMIRCEVDALPPYERNLIVARFAIEPKENLPAKIALIQSAFTLLGTGVHHYRLVDNLVQRYFGCKDVQLADWASRLNVHPSTITRKWQAIRNGFRKGEVRAQEMVEARIRDKGMIE